MDTNTNEIIIMTALFPKDDIVPGPLPKIECITGMCLLAITIIYYTIIITVYIIHSGGTYTMYAYFQT